MAEKKGFIGEFREFITKGSVMDMAVGTIIGSAFTSIINSLVTDVFTPVLSLLTNSVDLSEFKIVLSPETETVAENAIRYGTFIQKVITFIIQAFVIFLFVRMVNRIKAVATAKVTAEAEAKAAEDKAKKEAEEKAAKEKAEEPVVLLREILEELKKD